MTQTIPIKAYFELQTQFSDTVRELNLARNEIARMKYEQEEVVTEEESRAHHLELENSELKAELARLREATRWIPVGEGLPEDVCGGASTLVEVAFASWDEEDGTISNHYQRRLAQFWHKYGKWEMEWVNGIKSFEDYGYKVLFWRYQTPLPEPPEVDK